MKKLSVCVLFGGISPEHDVSLRSAESVLNNMDPEKYNIFPVGITKEGDWILYNSTDYSTDYSKLPGGQWLENPTNRRAAISPVRGQGLLSFEGDCVVRERIDVVFPVLHGENGEDGAMQGLLQTPMWAAWRISSQTMAFWWRPTTWKPWPRPWSVSIWTQICGRPCPAHPEYMRRILT